MRLPLILLLFLLIASAFSSCTKMPNDGIPFYLKIDSVSFAGGSTTNITDIWAEANASTLGAFERPCNIPVLLEGNVSFVLKPGIYESGQQGVRVPYTFYQADTFTINAVRGEKYSRIPVFRYKSGITVASSEDFESGNGYNGFAKVSPDTVYGFYCGQLTVSAVDSNEEAKEINSYPLQEGAETYLEIDYKAQVPFWAGFYGISNLGAVVKVPVVFIVANNKWNKLYINLTDILRTTNTDKYQLYFEALRPYGTNGGTVQIDNIKLIHF